MAAHKACGGQTGEGARQRGGSKRGCYKAAVRVCAVSPLMPAVGCGGRWYSAVETSSSSYWVCYSLSSGGEGGGKQRELLLGLLRPVQWVGWGGGANIGTSCRVGLGQRRWKRKLKGSKGGLETRKSSILAP